MTSSPGLSSTLPQRPGSVTVLLVVLLGVAVAARTVHTQQFATNDAVLTTFRACQLVAWRGETETRIEPACQPVRNLEITLGLGLGPENGAAIEDYTLELKTLFRELEPGAIGFGLAAGLSFAGQANADHGRSSGAFAYVPATLSVGEDRFLVHTNLGWRFERNMHQHGHNHAHNDENGHHSLTWSTRGDLYLPWLQERFVVVGELFGESGIRPEYQVGLRTWVVQDRLILDVSWGGHTASGFDGRGWVFGFGWTPPPFF